MLRLRVRVRLVRGAGKTRGIPLVLSAGNDVAMSTHVPVAKGECMDSVVWGRGRKGMANPAGAPSVSSNSKMSERLKNSRSSVMEWHRMWRSKSNMLERERMQKEGEVRNGKSPTYQPSRMSLVLRGACETTIEIILGDDAPYFFGTSPRRAAKRRKAFEGMSRQAAKMQRRAARRGPQEDVKVGSIVQVGLDQVDRGRADGTVLTCAVVEINVRVGHYRVVTQGGLLKNWLTRGAFTLLPHATLQLTGLKDAYDTWKQQETVGMRKANAATSLTGGQGFVKCVCRGMCNSARCTCYKLGRLCNSRCHQKSDNCCNLH